MSLEFRDEAERLVAEQAVLLRRSALAAMRSAKHGHGLETVETAVLTGGRALMQTIIQQTFSAHPEAQKGGDTAPCAAVRPSCVSKDIRASG